MYREVLNGKVLNVVVVFSIIAMAFILRVSKGPFYTDAVQDPSYFFLKSGLDLIEQGATQFTDNPGLTLTIVSALTIKSSMFCSGTYLSAIDYVSINSETLLERIHIILLILDAVLLLLILNSYSYKNNLTFTLSICLVFASWLPYQSWSEVSPEHLLVTLSFLQVYILISSKNKHRGLTILNGLLTGLGLLTKFTYLPVAAFALYKIKHKGLFLGITTSIFLAINFSFSENFPQSILFVVNHVMHSGYYGSGRFMHMQFSDICSAFIKSLLYLPLWGIGIVILLHFNYRTLLMNKQTPLLLAIIILYLLTAYKSFHFDYIICVYVMVMLLFGLQISRYVNRVNKFLFIICCVYFVPQLYFLYSNYTYINNQTSTIHKIIEEYIDRPKVFYENSSTLNYAKFFSGLNACNPESLVDGKNLYGYFSDSNIVYTSKRMIVNIESVVKTNSQFLVLGRNTNGLGNMNVLDLKHSIVGCDDSMLYNGKTQSIILFTRSE